MEEGQRWEDGLLAGVALRRPDGRLRFRGGLIFKAVVSLNTKRESNKGE